VEDVRPPLAVDLDIARGGPAGKLVGAQELRVGQPGRPADALREFERSLQTIPGRFRSIAGAADAAARSGNRAAATTYYRQLIALTSEADSERPAVTAARAFLKQ